MPVQHAWWRVNPVRYQGAIQAWSSTQAALPGTWHVAAHFMRRVADGANWPARWPSQTPACIKTDLCTAVPLRNLRCQHTARMHRLSAAAHALLSVHRTLQHEDTPKKLSLGLGSYTQECLIRHVSHDKHLPPVDSCSCGRPQRSPRATCSTARPH